eukprot:2505393-Rhodomonas_salina.1
MLLPVGRLGVLDAPTALWSAICLRACYAMRRTNTASGCLCGTDIAFCRCCIRAWRMVVSAYPMSGTDTAFGRIWLRNMRY